MSNNRSTGSGSRGYNSRGYHPPPPAPFPFYSPPNSHRGRAAPLYRSTSFPSGPTGHQGSSTHVVTTPPPTPRASSSSLDTYHSYYYDVEERAERRRVLQSFKCPFNEDGIVCKHNDNPEYCMFAHEDADVGLGWPISGSKVGNLNVNDENELKEIPPYVCIFSLLNSCRNRNSHSQSSTRSKFVDGPTGNGSTGTSATGTSATGSCTTGCSTTVTSTNGNFIGNYTSGSNNIESSIAKSTTTGNITTGNITTGNSSPGSSFIGNCSPGSGVTRNGITESSFIGNGTTESTTTGNGTTGNGTTGNSSNGSSVNRNGTKENSFIGNGTIGSSSTESTTTGNITTGNSSPGSSVTRNGFKGSTFIRNHTIESSFIENCTIEGSSTESTTNGSKVPEVATARPSTDVVLSATKKKIEVCSSGVHVQLEDMTDLDRFERENGEVIDKFYGPDKDRECCVCFDKVTSKRFAKNRKFALLESCAHVFCVCCIREWCSRSNRCPVCRVVSVRYVVRGRWIEDEESKRLFFADKRNLNCMFATINEVATRGRNHRPIRIRAVAEGNERQAFNALHNLQVLEAEAEELLRYFNLFEFQSPGNMDPFGIGDGDVNDLGNFPDGPLGPHNVPEPPETNPNLHYHPHDFMFRLPDHLVGEGFEPIYFTRSTLQALVDNRRRNGPSAAGENSTAPRTVAEVHHVNRNILRRLGYWLPDETTVGIGASAGGADNVSRTGSNVWNSPGRLASMGSGSARVGSAAGNVGNTSGNVGNASARIRSSAANGGSSSGRVGSATARVGSATARVGCASGNVVPSRPVEPLVNLISGNVTENISGLVDGSNPAPLVYGVTHMARGQSNEAIVNAILATMGVHFHEATTGSGSASPSPPPLPFGAPPPAHAHADADGHGHTHHSWDCPTCVHRQYGGTFSNASRALNRSPYVSGTIPEDDDADDEASPGSEQDISSSRNGATNGTRRSRGSALMRNYGEAVRKYGH